MNPTALLEAIRLLETVAREKRETITVPLTLEEFGVVESYRRMMKERE